MHAPRKSLKREKSAMTVSLYGNLFFVFIELIMAVYTRSQAVLLDAVYDSIEFFMLLPSIFLIPFLYKPSNEKHPFGYTQIESIFVVIKGITMTAVTLGLIVNNIEIMFHGGRTIHFSTVAYFEFSAFVLGILVYLFLKKKNRLTNSPIVEIEMNGWKIDSIVSLGMTLAFLLPYILTFDGAEKITPYLDQMITIILSLFMIPVPVKAVATGLRDLILLPPEADLVDEIKETIEPILSEYNCQKLYYDIVRTGRKLWISVYITLDQDLISITRFKSVQARCIEALAEKYPDFYLELLPDIEFNKKAAPK